MTAKTLKNLLSQGPLGELARQAAERRHLTERVRSALPTAAAPHLLGVRELPNGGLELSFDSSAWASQVRYELPRLGSQAVTVRVRPRSPDD